MKKSPLKMSTLSSKISVIVIVSLAIIFILLVVVFGRFAVFTMNHEVNSKGDMVASMFSQINATPLMRKDYYSLENNVVQLMKNKEIVFAEVYDSNNILLTVSGKKKPGIAVSDTKTFFKIIHNPDNLMIGLVRIGISAEVTKRNLRDVLVGGIAGLFIAAVLLGFFLNAVLIRLLNKPITALLHSVREFSDGNLEARASVQANDEIGNLAGEFNLMASRLNKSTALMKNIFESTPAMIITTDNQGIVTQWNSAAVKYSGIYSLDAIGKSIWDIAPMLRKYRDKFEMVLGRNHPESLYGEHLGDTHGRVYTVNFYPLVEDGSSGLVIRIDDITELEQKENELRQMQKMETIGTLAGGLAHDFNNILGGILGTTTLLQYQFGGETQPDRAEVYDNLSLISEASERAMGLVKQLLSLSKKQEMSFEACDLRDAVNQVVKLCRNTFDRSIEISASVPALPVMAYADPTQMQQVLLNLMINAKDAMTIMRGENEKQGGKLEVSVESMYADAVFTGYHPEAAEGFHWKLEVTDQGIGMDSKTIAKIFDPFFSKKGKGKGTGLGLSMVYNIVTMHHGFIDVYSEVGIGTAFKIYLPSILGNSAVASKTLSEKPAFTGSGLILVIDDDPIIQKVASHLFIELGYKIVQAYDGNEGITAYLEKSTDIRAVLLDMIMPKKSGRETLIELKKINPGVKVVLTSGFKYDDRVQSVIDCGADAFIEKPYTLQQLSDVFHSVLAK